ncbi:hypothetical protein ACRTC9_21675 [Vibrio vulnificus]|nr:hypothetical protein [Vibrio vulnificus]ELJ8822818.1 hypothetical protein [Vibrio parahaemolyticus]ELA3113568.1 hypothetical protein [Vibrio vulnificus]ELB7531406.1 hypothetical protein [Vibrio vulnificus]ELJ8846852.1 hypothetical protein [Vibrio parahaemolyticus]ELK2279499.1 hypothetical protein [Vibrio vulnificus]
MKNNVEKGVVITSQTGWNEAFLIGTEEELLSLANTIIDSVKSAKKDEFFGESVKTSNQVFSKLAPYSEVQFDWLVVTNSNEQTLEIATKVEGL